MIRINLLGRPRPKVKRRVAITGGLQVALFAIPVGVAILVLVVHHSMLKGNIATLREEIAHQQTELKTLQDVKKEVEEFRKQQDLLQARLNTISTLEKQQSGPQQLLEAVGSTVSETQTLWLTEMEQRGQNEIEFTGRAGSMDEISNFITSLQTSGFFSEVEIKEAKETVGQDGGSNFEFTLSAKFAPRAPATPAAEGQQPTAAGGGP